MAIPDGLKAVNDVITSPNWDLGRLMEKAAECAHRELKPPQGFPAGVFFGVAGCRTTYGMSSTLGYNNEMIAWFLGIILCEYAAGILAEKAKEGHCNAHRLAPTYQACPTMQAEHRKMLEAFRDRVKQLLGDVEVLVTQAQAPKPPPAVAPQAAGT